MGRWNRAFHRDAAVGRNDENEPPTYQQSYYPLKNGIELYKVYSRTWTRTCTVQLQFPMPMISGWVPSTIIEGTKKVLDIMHRGSRELK
jgi:hypothetical protein